MPITEKMILVDTSLCMGCRGCQVACKGWHQLPAEVTTFTGTYENPLDLSGITYTRVTFNEVAGLSALKYLEWLFFKDQCLHCVKPDCQMACTVSGAIVIDDSGAVVITDACDPSICVTRPCENKCSFSVPRLNAEVNKEVKCDFCFDRIADGKIPICAKTCPSDAITFGEIDDIKALSEQRLLELQAKYPDANIYPDPAGKGAGFGQEGHVRWMLIVDPSLYGLS